MTHEEVLHLIHSEKSQTLPPVSSIDPVLVANAIQDAKDVRQQALVNAKTALEEAFQMKLNENFAKAEEENKIIEREKTLGNDIKEILVQEHPDKKDFIRDGIDKIMEKHGTKVTHMMPTDPTNNVPPELSTNPARSKNFEETKKIVEIFREKTAIYPKYISYEGAMVICVMLSMKDVAKLHISNLPVVDQEVIRSLWPDNAPVKSPTNFSAKFDENKDFILFDFYTLKNFTINLLNAVAHPRPEDLKDVWIGQVPVEDVGDQIAVGKNIVMNKRTIQKLMGVELKEQKKVEYTSSEEETSFKRQPVSGRNAYEIRADVLQMAIDWADSGRRESPRCKDDDIVSLAKKFYSFVENRR